jgi:RNA-directed DNA polymerase
MTHGPEKSDPAIVARKPTSDAGQPAEELVEPRAGTKGNADQHHSRRTQGRERLSQALARVREAAKSARFVATHPRWEPYAGKPHVRFCAGGAG